MFSIFLACVLILFLQVNNQSDYFTTLTTDFASLNTSSSTVVISESKDLGPCSCDLTPDACDYHCCCDLDCPDKVTAAWIGDSSNICLDKSKKIFNFRGG